MNNPIENYENFINRKICYKCHKAQSINRKKCLKKNCNGDLRNRKVKTI